MFEASQSIPLAASILQVAHIAANSRQDILSEDLKRVCAELFPDADSYPIVTLLCLDWNGSIKWANQVLEEEEQLRRDLEDAFILASIELLFATGRPVFVTDAEGNPVIAVMVPSI